MEIKKELRNQVSVRERQYDFESKWAQEHEEKTKEGSTPEGLLAEKEKKVMLEVNKLGFEF